MADNYTVQIDLEIIDAEETEMILEKFTGTDGKSAYQYAVEHGYTGTEEEFAEYMANAAEYSEHIQETVDDAIQDALDSGDFVPDMDIGTVQTVPHGQSASATITGTKRNPVLNLNIPQGASGNETIDDTAGFGDDDLVWSADKTLKEVDSKADVICKTIDTPASIITIEDGADDLPVKEMKVAIEPVQDLNGYDHPWPGGGGKNLGKVNTEAGTGLSRGLTATTNDDGSVTIKGKYTSQSTGTIGNTSADADLLIPAGSYILTGTPTDSYINYGLRLNILKNDGTSVGYDGGNGLSFSFEEDTLITLRIHVDWGKAYNVQLPTNGVTFYPMIRKSTDSDVFAPYENICLITGWTGCNVTRTGKNLFDGVYTTGKLISDAGAENTNADHKISTNYIPVKASSYYTISGKDIHKRPSGSSSTSNTFVNVAHYRADKSFIDRAFSSQTSDLSYAFETTEETAYVRFTVSIEGYDVQVEYGQEASGYTPFVSADVYPITFPSSAGTVYGGNLTIHADGTGELVVNRAFYDITNCSFGRVTVGTGRFRLILSSNNMTPSVGRNASIISSHFKGIDESGVDNEGTWIFCTGNDQIVGQFGDASYDTVEKIRAFFTEQANAGNPVTICYEVNATSYQLSAPQVRTLLGLNKIFADTGNINLLTYPVDTAIALDNQTATTQSIIAGTDSTVATESHAVGDVFICDNKLYKATDAIAVGESIIEGSNVIQTSVAELIVKGPQFVCNFGLSKNEYVELQMTGVARAVAFVSGASAGRNGTIHAFSNESSVYAESVTSFNNVSVSYNNADRTVKIQNTGNDDIYVDVLKFYGDIKGTWVMPLGI